MNEVLAKYNIDENKYYPLSMLHDIMTDLGLTSTTRKSFTTDFISRKIESGELALPPKATKKRWFLQGKDIVGIVTSFIPGGKGYYNWNESTPAENQNG